MNTLFWKRASTPEKAIAVIADKDTIELVPEISPGTLTAAKERVDVETVADRLLDRRSRVRQGAIYWLWMLAAPLLGLACMVSLLGLTGLGLSGLALALLYGFLLMTVRLLHGLTDRLQQTRAALHNSHLGREWLGPLAEALAWPDRRVQGSAALLLTQALPRLTVEDGDIFTEVQRNCLYQRLMPRAASADPELALAILSALPVIGTEEALRNVNCLATLRGLTRRQRRVRQAARASLAQLERRAAAQRDTQADAPIAPALTLSAAAAELTQNQEDTIAEDKIAEDKIAEDKKEEMAAASALVDAQLQEFEAEIRKLQAPGMRVGFLIASWGVILPYCAVQTYLQFAGGNYPAGLVFCVLTLLSTQLRRFTLTAKHHLLAHRLAHIEDVRCVGRLSEALEWPDTTIRYIAVAALTRLLPRVKASDNTLYTPRQRANLYRMLTRANIQKYDNCLIAILKALQQIGDETALPYVEQLANTHPMSNQESKVCDAARDCLPFLRERASQTQSSQTLLRASSATATGNEMLVRPANGVSLGDHEQLLRAGQASETL